MIIEHGSLHWFCIFTLDHYKKLRLRNTNVYLSGAMEFSEYAKFNSFYTAQIQLLNKLILHENGFFLEDTNYTHNVKR